MRILNPSALGGGGGAISRAFVSITGGATPVISKSTNVSSITDNGQGRIIVTFANDLPDTDYSVSGIPQQVVDNAIAFTPTLRASQKLVGSCEMFFVTATSSLNDPESISLSFLEA